MRALFEVDHWLEVLQTLSRHRLRTFLTAFGVFWGVLMLVVMLGFGRGLETGAVTSFGSFARNSFIVWGEPTSRPWAGRGPGRRVQFTLDDVRAVEAGVSGVEAVLPRNFMSGRFGQNAVSRRDKTETFNLSGEEADYLKLEALEIERGRFLDPADLDEARKVAVIGPRVRSVMFGPDEDPIGQSIRLGRTEVTVVGVYKPTSGGGRPEWRDGRVLVPRTTLARMNGTGDRINGLAVLVRAGAVPDEVEARAKALLRARHGVHPEDPRGVGGFNRAREFRKVTDLFTGISVLTWVVGVLTLFAGAMGVSNIMMIAVAERTREIGIRKAIGATPASLVLQVVTEATALTALAGYLGVTAGVALVEAAGRIFAAMPPGQGPSFFGPPSIDLPRTLLAAGVLTAAGALSGLAPARSAVAIRPVEALAHE